MYQITFTFSLFGNFSLQILLGINTIKGNPFSLEFIPGKFKITIINLELMKKNIQHLHQNWSPQFLPVWVAPSTSRLTFLQTKRI